MSSVATTEQKNEVLTLHKQILDTVELYAKESKALEGRLESTVQAKIDKLNAAIDQRMDAIEVRVNRPQAAVTETLAKDFNPARKSAFDGYLRKGVNVGPDHLKLLTEGDDTTGGYFVIPEYLNDIIKQVILYSPVRQYARIKTTNSNSVKVPKRTAMFAATWTAEAQQQVEAQGLKYGMEDVPNHAMTAFADISNEDLADSMFDMAAQLNEEFAEQFAFAEGNAFIGGSGKGQPEGIMTNTSIAYTPSGQASTLSASGDEFTNCAYAMKEAYARNAVWFLNRQSIGAVRLLKDAQNRPLWLPFAQSGLAGAEGPTIVGIPYAEMPAMPNIAAGNYPIVLGDWKRAYLIVDRVQISIIRDNLTQATKQVTRFLASKRVGGQILLTEAVRKIKIATN